VGAGQQRHRFFFEPRHLGNYDVGTSSFLTLFSNLAIFGRGGGQPSNIQNSQKHNFKRPTFKCTRLRGSEKRCNVVAEQGGCKGRRGAPRNVQPANSRSVRLLRARLAYALRVREELRAKLTAATRSKAWEGTSRGRPNRSAYSDLFI
jgi:hypothetical protein